MNVTPDSFSDGGRHADTEAAVAHGLRLVAEGADVVDVGGESTRPGASPRAGRAECDRVLPVVERLVRELGGPAVSVDTMKAEVARRAAELGAGWINDPSGGDAILHAWRGGVLVGTLRVHRMRGTPRRCRSTSIYGDAAAEVLEELRAKVARCVAAGIGPERLAIDPGIGFAKRLEHNLELLARLHELRGLGLPILVGTSRKSFVGSSSGVGDPAERVEGSVASACAAATRGASGVRVPRRARDGARARGDDGDRSRGAGGAGLMFDLPSCGRGSSSHGPVGADLRLPAARAAVARQPPRVDGARDGDCSSSCSCGD
ncbi:MAG: dihydropteroate synthase [Planctomycetota bacterium]